MELSELKNTWLEYERKLDRTWKLNLHLLRTTNLDKAKSKMKNLTWMAGAALAFNLLLSLLLISFTFQHLTTIHMVAAGIVLTIWTSAMSIGAIKQLELIRKIDYSEPVTMLQKKLEALKLVILKYIRITVWILPFYMSFQILFTELLFDYDIMKHADRNWLNWQIAISIAFIPVSILLYQKLSPKNIHKSWMNKVLKGNLGLITEAIVFIKEIEKFEKEA